MEMGDKAVVDDLLDEGRRRVWRPIAIAGFGGTAQLIVTWLIHALYLGSLVRRYSRLRQQMKELEK